MIIFNVLHLLGAVFIIGPMAILPMLGLGALRTGNHAMVLRIAASLRVLNYLSLLVAVFGFGLMGTSSPEYKLSVTTPWILTSIILYLVAFLVTTFVVLPTLFTAGRAVTAAGEEKPAGYPALAASSGITALLLVAVVVLMVWKP
ncbi:MAG: DUF2269 family protein [Rhodoglobus sp.]